MNYQVNDIVRFKTADIAKKGTYGIVTEESAKSGMVTVKVYSLGYNVGENTAVIININTNKIESTEFRVNDIVVVSAKLAGTEVGNVGILTDVSDFHFGVVFPGLTTGHALHEDNIYKRDGWWVAPERLIRLDSICSKEQRVNLIRGTSNKGKEQNKPSHTRKCCTRKPILAIEELDSKIAETNKRINELDHRVKHRNSNLSARITGLYNNLTGHSPTEHVELGSCNMAILELATILGEVENTAEDFAIGDMVKYTGDHKCIADPTRYGSITGITKDEPSILFTQYSTGDTWWLYSKDVAIV